MRVHIFIWALMLFSATDMLVHAHMRCTPAVCMMETNSGRKYQIKCRFKKCHSSFFPLANYSVSLHQGEAFLCLPCPSTGITLWPPGAPSSSWRWPSLSEPSVAADNTLPPRRASCQWPITALPSASSILTGPPVWPPQGWSRS